MPISKKGVKKVSKGLRAYAKAGERIAVNAPIAAYDAFLGSPPQDSPGRDAWLAALKRISNHEAWADVDSAHGDALAELSEESFLTGFFAGVAFAKVGAR